MNEAIRFVLHRDAVVGRAERLLALSFVCTLLVMGLVTLPIQHRFVGIFPVFFQIYGVVLAGLAALTALLLLWRASTTQNGNLAILGAAYLFTTPLAIANVLTLPGVLFPPGSFHSQTAPCIWVFWQLGFAIGVFPFAARRTGKAIRPVLLVLGALLLSCACIAIAIVTPNLPIMVTPSGEFTPLVRLTDGIGLFIYCSELALLHRRNKKLTTLELWVGVALLTLALDRFLFSQILGLWRFTVGYYIARIFLIISGTLVLGAMFADLLRTIRRADAIDGYAAVTESLPIITVILDAEGSCVFVNPAWEKLTGQHVSEALGSGFQQAIHPRDLANIHTDPALDNDRQIRISEKATGQYRRHLLRTTSLGAEIQGRAAGSTMLVAIDVEDRVRAETARREADLRLQAFLEVVPQIIWTTDPTGSMEWCNPAWYAYTGLSSRQTLGWGWQTGHHPEELTAIIDRWEATLVSGQPFQMEYRLRHRDGTYEWFLCNAVPLLDDDDGKIIRWFGSCTNIDAQKRQSERSTRIARILQEALLPERLPLVTGLHIDAVYRPAESEGLVGGDWYDVIVLPDGRVLFSCGDVLGHGLSAATLAGRYRQSIAVTGVENPDPASVLMRVNRIAMLQEEGMATAVVAIFDPKSLTLRYALAGHPEPVVALPGKETFTLKAGDLPIGILPDAVWVTHEVQLCKDAFVIFYTDGLTEFGRDALSAERALSVAVIAMAERNTGHPATEIMERVLAGAIPNDDIAILTLCCGPERVEPIDERNILVRSWRFHSSDARTAHTIRVTLSDFLNSFAKDKNATFAAELVVGEIIANTVEHAPGLVEVHIDWMEAQPIFTVHDTGPGFEERATPTQVDPFSENGRGIFLIHALASDVVMKRAPGFGTEISCKLPIERVKEVHKEPARAGKREHHNAASWESTCCG